MQEESIFEQDLYLEKTTMTEGQKILIGVGLFIIFSVLGFFIGWNRQKRKGK